MNNHLIVAHRGASYAAPENTLPSFELAFKENADFIEGDFWLTKDDEIVCIHDPDTKRVTEEKIKMKVRSSTLAELKKLDVGSWKRSTYKGTAIPTLQEILQIIPIGKGIYIEIKDAREIFVKKLMKIMEQSFISTEKIRIIAFNPKTILLAKKYLPGIKAYWLFVWYLFEKKCLKSLAQRRLMHTLGTLSCDGINVNAAPFVDERLVKSIRGNNLDFCVHDVENVEDAVRMINLGVDSITTDSPLRIREGIEKYSLSKTHSNQVIKS